MSKFDFIVRDPCYEGKEGKLISKSCVICVFGLKEAKNIGGLVCFNHSERALFGHGKFNRKWGNCIRCNWYFLRKRETRGFLQRMFRDCF